MATIPVRVSVIQLHPDAPLPHYATVNAAGADLHAMLDETLELNPFARALVPTGIALAIPDGYEGQVRPRSGLASRHGITVLNSPGTIDGDYRGEVQVLLINLGDQPVMLSPGERIAQLVIAPIARAQWCVVDALPDTERGSGGFGSTGV